jgi:hypothetical protein
VEKRKKQRQSRKSERRRWNLVSEMEMAKCGCGKKAFATVAGKVYCYSCYDKNVNEERAKGEPVLGR